MSNCSKNLLKTLSVGNENIQLPEEQRKELMEKGVCRTEGEMS